MAGTPVVGWFVISLFNKKSNMVLLITFGAKNIITSETNAYTNIGD